MLKIWNKYKFKDSIYLSLVKGKISSLSAGILAIFAHYIVLASYLYTYKMSKAFVYLFLDTVDSLITHLLVNSKLSLWEKERQATAHT